MACNAGNVCRDGTRWRQRIRWMCGETTATSRVLDAVAREAVRDDEPACCTIMPLMACAGEQHARLPWARSQGGRRRGTRHKD